MRAITGTVQSEVGAWTFHLLGYCSASEDRLRNEFESGKYRELSLHHGDYVLIFERGSDVHLFSSPYGLLNYYCLVHEGRLHHGQIVLDLVRQAKIGWEWDYEAIAFTLELSHPVEQMTLHRRIRRLPARSHLHFVNGRLDIQSQPFSELDHSCETTADQAVHALNEEVARFGSNESVIAISAGMDSRVVLSAFLANGLQPKLLVAGRENHANVQMAKALADRFHLEIETVSLELEEYVEAADTITHLTNGTNAFDAWHTYLFPKMSQILKGRTMFTGNAAEFVRTWAYYPPHLRTIAYFLHSFPKPMLRAFWDKKLPHGFQQMADQACEGLAKELTPAGHSKRVETMMRLCYNDLWQGRERYLMEQRERHFHGNGRMLSEQSAPWRCPFVSMDWAKAVHHLPLHWRLASNWHRHALAKNCSALLEFPEEGIPGPMPEHVGLLGGLSRKRKVDSGPNIGEYAEWLRSDTILSLLDRHPGHTLWKPEAIARRRAWLQSGQTPIPAKRLVAYLLPLGVFDDLAHRAID